MSRVSATSGTRRFESAEIDPARAVALRADHPAVIEGRTIFPGSVLDTMSSPRFLVSGHNNSKLGKAVLKGPRAGWPIYHLTLEERATCPRSCAQWAGCYGNAMPYARRHRVDAEFMATLRGEIVTVARQHPEGLLIRLHTLGDFFSVDYVLMWAELIARLPQLHAFGYTARRVDDPDPQSARIASAIALLTRGAWSRFAIRTSGIQGAQGSIVVDADPDLPDVIACPAQVHATEACATCGLCWADGARSKAIAFLRHGMKRNDGPRAPRRAPVAAAPVPAPPQEPGFSAMQTASMSKVLAVLEGLYSGGSIEISFSVMSRLAGVPHGSISFLLDSLAKRGLVTILRGVNRQPNRYILNQPPSGPQRLAPIEAPRRGRPPKAAKPPPPHEPFAGRVVRVGAPEVPTVQFLCRRTEVDRRPPGRNVTAVLMGDPAPGRFPWTGGAE